MILTMMTVYVDRLDSCWVATELDRPAHQRHAHRGFANAGTVPRDEQGGRVRTAHGRVALAKGQTAVKVPARLIILSRYSAADLQPLLGPSLRRLRLLDEKYKKVDQDPQAPNGVPIVAPQTDRKVVALRKKTIPGPSRQPRAC